MTLGSKIAWDDTVLPFQLDRSDIRGRVARLDGVLSGILKQHNYPAPVEALVAEMALLTALIGQTIKLRWKLSLQIQTKGAVRMIATDFYAPEAEDLLDEACDTVAAKVELALSEGVRDVEQLEREVRRAAGKFVSERTKRKPMIVPVVMEA